MSNEVAKYIVYYHEGLETFCLARGIDDDSEYFNPQTGSWNFGANACWHESLPFILKAARKTMVSGFEFCFSSYSYKVQ